MTNPIALMKKLLLVKSKFFSSKSPKFEKFFRDSGSKIKAVMGKISPTPNNSKIVAQIIRKKIKKKSFFCLLESINVRLLNIDIRFS